MAKGRRRAPKTRRAQLGYWLTAAALAATLTLALAYVLGIWP